MLNQLLETIIQILTGWVDKFTSHAQHVEDKLDSLDQTASDIETNTEPISDIADNTGAVITPIQNIKSNTDSIKQSSQTSANNTTAILNNISTLSTNTGRAAAYAQDCANNTLDIKDKVTTIASDTTQLRADTAELNDMSDKIYEAIKWSLADKYIDETESGASPMSFDTDIADDLESLIIEIEAQQAGSGDPSPSNIRSISGYANATIAVNGNNIVIALGQTVYFGSLNAITGELIITYAAQPISNFTWTKNSDISFDYYSTGNIANKASNTNFICECFVNKNNYRSSLSDNEIGVYNFTTGSRRFCIRCDSITSASDLTSQLGSYLICFELGTPVTITLTAQQIAAIKGVNTITSDTNGVIEVTYKESIKHYLDKQDN